jgi:hypothetical protein
MTAIGTTLIDFRALFAAIGVERFFAKYWQRQVFFDRLDPASFAHFAQAVGTLDIGRCTGLARGGVQAWIANEQIAHSVLPVDTAGASRAFRGGATLYFIDVPLEGLKRDLGNFLGVRPRDIIASLFLTPAGGGAAWHFDRNENFTVQLTGAKRWAVAQAPTVVAAPESYILGQHAPDALADLLDDVKAAPAHTTIDLVQGSVLYVPRGTLHRTETGTESWSLNLSYGCAMWIDLVCTGLREQLANSARWRASVTGLGDDCDPSARQANILPDLLRDLRALLEQPNAPEELSRRFLQTAADD